MTPGQRVEYLAWRRRARRGALVFAVVLVLWIAAVWTVAIPHT